ncbi:MAG: helicase HerA-like domain-containing protein [Allosphingosinicella sp.]
MDSEEAIFVGQGTRGPVQLRLDHANRHGLIAGATGTGKTVTLQGLVEGFSRAGVPVFAADVKGDLAGLAMPGDPTQKTHEPFTRRAAEIGLTDYAYADNPVIFWDLFGEQGHPLRTTVTEMGPLLLARLLDLNETQEGVLNIAFRLADDQGLLLLNLDDLQSMLAHCATQAAELTARYGNVSKASVGAIQRQLLAFASQGADRFFGEPALAIADFLQTDESGRGYVNILAANRLMTQPKLYATFLLWLLSELFEELPEVGDPVQPRLVFFFDEAHLLFADAPQALREKVEQVVRLIRSKGVGVYFITQNPADIPDAVAGQLGNRVQHALRAYTPADQRAIRAAAETFRSNPDVDVATAITELRTGEALVSLLDQDGAPTPVDRALIRPPFSRAGALSDKERAVLRSLSPVGDRYDQPLDRESAHEILGQRAAEAAAAAAAARSQQDAEKAQRDAEKAQRTAASVERARQRDAPMHEQVVRQLGRSVQRQLTNRIAGQIVRGLLGGLFRGR